MVIGLRNEPDNLATRPIKAAPFSATRVALRMFNADLAIADERLVQHPYLAEALPQLNSDAWRVFPDGQMETTWRLKPNLAWHDGTPLSAEDFVFAWRVYSTPEFGGSGSRLMRALQEVAAPDAR